MHRQKLEKTTMIALEPDVLLSLIQLHKHGSGYIVRNASIVKSFERASIPLPPDGSQDHKLHIRRLPDFTIE